MKNIYTRGLMMSPVLVVLFMIDIQAQSFVYTDDNVPGPNSVTAFSVAANGALTNIGTFATGGSGNAAMLNIPIAARARDVRDANCARCGFLPALREADFLLLPGKNRSVSVARSANETLLSKESQLERQV